jgi:hypothetical protein
MSVKEGQFRSTVSATLGANPSTLYFTPQFDDSGNFLHRFTQTSTMIIYGNIPKGDGIDYWSLCLYLMNRSEKALLASLNDSLNHFEVGPESNIVIIVVTRNKAIADYLQKGYTDQGYKVFILAIPNIVLDSDLLTVLGRVTLLAETEVTVKPKMDFLVKFISLDTFSNFIPYIIGYNMVLKPRAVRNPEQPRYMLAFQQYIASIASKYKVVMVTEYLDFLGGGVYTGYDAIASNQNAFLDNRDTSYKVITGFKLQPNQMFLIFGVNHVITGKGYYTANSVYNDKNPIGTYTIRKDQTTSEFYTLCIGPDSILSRVNDENITKKIPIPGELENVTFIERCYCQQPENVGPASSTIISPVVMVIDFGPQNTILF